jgi:hypothetical protein
MGYVFSVNLYCRIRAYKDRPIDKKIVVGGLCKHPWIRLIRPCHGFHIEEL